MFKCAVTGEPVTGSADAVYEDGEWISFNYLMQCAEGENLEGDEPSEMQYLESQADSSTLRRYHILDDLVNVAKDYLSVTGRHLPIYGELGELYGEIKYGIKRHAMYNEGSDGKLGKEVVEIKTISPFKSTISVMVKKAGDFTKLLLVKIDEDFEFHSKLFDRTELKSGGAKFAIAKWGDEEDLNE